MATLYPAKSNLEPIPVPEGGLTASTIAALIKGDPTYIRVEGLGIVAIVTGVDTLSFTINQHNRILRQPIFSGDALLMRPDELAQAEFADTARWV